jgi:hypothetical protein
VTGSYERVNKPLFSIRDDEFLDELLEKKFLHAVISL